MTSSDEVFLVVKSKMASKMATVLVDRPKSFISLYYLVDFEDLDSIPYLFVATI